MLSELLQVAQYYQQCPMKYNYQSMYFGNPQVLENNLSQDWTTLIKNIRIREDYYHQLALHYHRIFQKQSINQDNIGLSVQIQQNNALITKIRQQESQLREEELQIIEKYEGSITSFENCIKLMGRIGAKILQMLKTASDRVRSFDAYASSRYNSFKTVFMGLLTQRDKLSLEAAVKVVLDYCKQKLQLFVTKVQKSVNDSKARQVDFHEQKSTKLNSERPLPISQRERQNNFFKKKKELSIREPSKQQRFDSKQLHKQKTQPQKYEKSESKYKQIKQKSEFKPLQKHQKSEKPLKKKFKLYDNLHNVMLLSKHQPNEDIVGNVEIDKQKMYNELLSKNKQNMTHIITFQNRYEELQLKPQNFEQKINKKCQIQNKSMGFILKIKKQSTQSQENNDKVDFFNYIATEIESNTIDSNQPSLNNHMKKIANTRTKFNNSPQIKRDDFPQLSCKINNQFMTSIKYDASKQQRQQNIKGRLPDIKRASLDQKTNLFNHKTISDYKETIDNIEESGFRQSKKRQSFFREERVQSQRAKMVLKSVQVALDISNKKGQRFCKQQELSSRQRKKTDTTIESTIYMRKTINKFLDNKLNLFF